MRIVKLLQGYNENQEDENINIRDQIKSINAKIKDFEDNEMMHP